MFDAHYARMVTDLVRYPNVFTKGIKAYIPCTRNPQLDEVLEEIFKRAKKGFSFVAGKELELTTVQGLHNRYFIIEHVGGNIYNISW